MILVHKSVHHSPGTKQEQNFDRALERNKIHWHFFPRLPPSGSLSDYLARWRLRVLFTLLFRSRRDIHTSTEGSEWYRWYRCVFDWSQKGIGVSTHAYCFHAPFMISCARVLNHRWLRYPLNPRKAATSYCFVVSQKRQNFARGMRTVPFRSRVHWFREFRPKKYTKEIQKSEKSRKNWNWIRIFFLRMTHVNSRLKW